jgi:hypothetical protein
MARSRNLKPSFFKNEDLAECCMEARLCFAGLWCLADREGRLEDRPKRIKGELFAFDSVEVEPLLQQLADRGFIVRYRVADQALIQVVKFAKHQAPHYKEAASTLPAPPGWVPPSPQKPEASDSMNDGEAPGLAADDQGGLPSNDRGANRADSLFSDSLQPDSLKRNGKSRATSRSTPAAPPWMQLIVDAYHEALPELPAVRVMDKGREQVLRKFRDYVLTTPKPDGSPRATNDEELLDWTRLFFARARENDFLMGRTQRSEQHKNWRPDIEFLLKPAGIKHVLEKTDDASPNDWTRAAYV